MHKRSFKGNLQRSKRSLKTTRVYEDEVMKLNTLMTRRLVRGILQSIQEIPLCQDPGLGIWIWHYTESSQCTVASAYRLARKENYSRIRQHHRISMDFSGKPFRTLGFHPVLKLMFRDGAIKPSPPESNWPRYVSIRISRAGGSSMVVVKENEEWGRPNRNWGAGKRQSGNYYKSDGTISFTMSFSPNYGSTSGDSGTVLGKKIDDAGRKMVMWKFQIHLPFCRVTYQPYRLEGDLSALQIGGQTLMRTRNHSLHWRGWPRLRGMWTSPSGQPVVLAVSSWSGLRFRFCRPSSDRLGIPV
ncbi:hypothetical protein M9H77_35759 [Catharanthus roseus]|uniref:Uncharacterized protein n=1 Tax=Catharanthus roseus TaxID=4058 RepID=A0ACB9ZRM8_CATRO|nr:hypothetical protein M9H77_35759 [Catharanthus roseus]